MKKKTPNCDLCFEKAELHLALTETAIFHTCFKHAKKLSDIIYPVGNKLGAAKIPHLMSVFSKKL